VIDTLGGTPESAWHESGLFQEMLRFALERVERAVVVAPHPDDEILGLGGTLALLSEAGVEVVLVAVTDGEASHAPSAFPSAEELRARRPEESMIALDRLGIEAQRVVRLGIGDGQVAGTETELAEAIRHEIDAASWVFAPWEHDGHPDHEAAGRAAARAARSSGARYAWYLIWAWHYLEPFDRSIAWGRMRAVPLPSSVTEAKSRAVKAFTTQIESVGDMPAILPPVVLEHFSRPFETILLP